MNIDAVIFDLDGTLWDSCRVVSESWSETLKTQYGIPDGPDPQAVRGIMGMTAEEICDTLFRQHGENALQICLDCIHGENAYIASRGGDLYSSVPETLKELSGRLPLFIVSNCLCGYIECFLESSGLGPLFRGHLCAEETGLGKAGNLALLAGRYSLKSPVYVGDTVMDERSARQAGLPFIHAAYGFGAAEAPDAVIASPADLPAALRELEARHG